MFGVFVATKFALLGSRKRGIGLSSRSIVEGSANGTTLGTATLPPGTTGTAVWSLTDALGVFQINSSTGVITVLSNTNLVFASHPTIPIVISVSGVTPSVPDLNVSITVTQAAGATAGQSIGLLLALTKAA